MIKKIILLFISTFNIFSAGPNQVTLKSSVKKADQALSKINSQTLPPVAPCNTSFHIADDECGSRVPASYWTQFTYKLSQEKSEDPILESEKMFSYINGIKDLSPEAKSEMKIIYDSIKSNESRLKAIDTYGRYLKDNDQKKLKDDLAKLKYSKNEIEDFAKNMENNPLGKNIKTLSAYGISYNSQKGGWIRSETNSKGVITPNKISADPLLKNSLQEVFGDDVVKQLSNSKRSESLNLGNIVFTPPIDGERMATYSAHEWNEKVQSHLDLYYREIKEASEGIPKLGTMWDGWKLHSSRSHLKLVNDQYDRFNNASVQVDALTKMGFPRSECFKLSEQINRLSTSSAETVNDIYNEAEGLRKKLYGVAAGAAFAITPMGQGLLIDSFAGSLGYLAMAGIALPYVQNAVNAGIKVSVDGGSWLCQYKKTLANAMADSALNSITMAVIPIPQGGNILKSLDALKKIIKPLYSGGKAAWSVGGKLVDCYNVTQAFKDIESEVDFYSELHDQSALAEIKLSSDELYKSMLTTCTDLAFAGVKLGMSNINSKIQKAREKEDEKSFKKNMERKDATTISPKVEQDKNITTPSLSDGKSFYKATNGTTYEVKVIPNSNGSSNVIFLSGDRRNKVGTMSDSNLKDLSLAGRLTSIILKD